MNRTAANFAGLLAWR